MPGLVPRLSTGPAPALAPGPVEPTWISDSETWSPAEEQTAALVTSDARLPGPALVPPAGATPASSTLPGPMASPAGIATTRPTGFPAHLRVRANVRPARVEGAATTAVPGATTAAPAVEALPADPMDPRLERAMTEVLRRAARRQGIDV